MIMRSEDSQAYPPGWDLLASWVAVIETGSVSMAAQRLGISQAGVSQHIKQLESMLQVELLDRTTRPATPTTSGHRLFDHATDLIYQARQMVESVRQLNRGRRSLVRMGCVDSFAATIGPQLVRGLSSTVSKVRLFSGLSPALDLQFANRELDLLITTSDLTDRPNLHCIALMAEQYFVVVPARHAVATGMSLHELASQLKLMRYSTRSVLGAHIDNYLRQAEPGIERTAEFDATDPLLSLVNAGLGFAITTPLCLWQARHFVTGLRVLPLSTFSRAGRPYPSLWRTFYLVCRDKESGSLPHEVHDVVRVARQSIILEITKGLAIDASAFRTEFEQ